MTSCAPTRPRSITSARVRPDEAEAKRRARPRGASASDPAQAVLPARELSGGQKARLALLLPRRSTRRSYSFSTSRRTISTSKSREALVEALTEYSGAVVLVSHDMHLLSLVADRPLARRGGPRDPLRRRPRRLPPEAPVRTRRRSRRRRRQRRNRSRNPPISPI